MKKIIVLNCSPRKVFNTAKLLQEAKKGAESVGAEVEYFNLVDFNFKGCMSCYACKRKGATTNGLCAYKDELTPILEKILSADAVIIGSPVYYGNQTGMFRNLMERLLFAAGTYLKDETTGFIKRVLHRRIPFGIIHTMSATEMQYKQSFMPALFGLNNTMTKLLFGYCETLNVFDTSHVADYSKYDCDMFDIEHKKMMKNIQFPKDLDKAFDMGKRFAMYTP